MATATRDSRDLVARLQERLAESLLSGDVALPPARLKESAEFLLEAAQTRPPERGNVVVRSAPGARLTRIAVVNRDMPFLVDSIAAAVAAERLTIDVLLHPIVPVLRDEAGRVVEFHDEPAAGVPRESLIYLETPRMDARERRTLEHELGVTLSDVRCAVEDWPAMRDAMLSDAGSLGDGEGADLLRWFAGGMLTQLGHVRRHSDGSESERLGICRGSAGQLLADDSYGRAFAWFEDRKRSEAGTPLMIKANRQARVHRRVPLDVFFVPVVERGKIAALSVHAGIWTSAALAEPPGEVPILRRHLAGIGKKLGFTPGSHDAKALVHALTALPHDVMIGFGKEDLQRVATTMMSLTDRPRPRLAIVVAPLKRHAFAFVWLPRDMLSTTTRLRIQELIESHTGAETLDWSLLVEGGNLALLRFVLDLRGQNQPDEEALNRRLQDMLRGWVDGVAAALAKTGDAGRAALLAARYAEVLPEGYRTVYSPEEAALDIDRLRKLGGAGGERPLQRDVRLYRMAGDAPDELRLKVYQLGGAMPLSDTVPALENFGFKVLSETPTELEGAGGGAIYDFRLARLSGEDAGQLVARREAIEAAIGSVLNGRAENDEFNRLVSGAALSAQEAEWLRALYRYLRQVNIAFTITTVVDALGRAPELARALIDLLRARHDPGAKGNRNQASAQAEERIRVALGKVAAINDDRLLRLYWAVIGAILRTNAFLPTAAEALAFKLDSAQVPGLPRPVPWREIWVYSRRVEGIHLRAGRVARGGIRWSDRRDDFRTEILGLMKAQRVKNAVIVPTGAKGGFYPKQLPDQGADRAAWAAEGLSSYQLFIRSLLSLTDNIAAGKVVHPQGMVIHDGDDPYFVVAADKGTASFSDAANALALEQDFWLGDAFASGGSNGYDHKAMGITARGAWLSVQQHFAELGIDVQKDPVRVVGCGDMSGDVFGNGMLLSQSLRLVAAFDHRHVFIDPEPEPETSWKERRRLFDKPGSSWGDYSEKLLSKGGGIYPRSEKSIALSAEARAVLGVEASALDPEALITAILKSPADLIWFGGIGTYIRASTETDAQVGDPVNDRLRVSGDEVRAKVIGEGANLGVTQAGRIEFALHGGRINTDFIDNSAGVDCSDNEVNIKIALNQAEREGQLTERRRIAVLREMTDDVAELVLEDNRLQALALSIAETGGAIAVPSLTRLIETLEASGELDRKTEGLADSDTFKRRALEGRGLTRPELAVLLSTTKLVLQDAIESSPVALDEATVPLLLSDFPPLMRSKFKQRLLNHRLRSQIVATVAANRIINRMGLVHPFELAEEEGAPLDHVAAAFITACDLLEIESLWSAIDAAAMAETARVQLFEQIALALRGHMADLLRVAGAKLSPSQLGKELRTSVSQLTNKVENLLAKEARGQAQAIASTLVRQGAPEELARTAARLFALDGAIGLARLSCDTGMPAAPLTQAFGDLGERLGLGWAQATAAVMNPSNPWERLLVAGLARDFQQMRLEFLGALTGRKRANGDPQAAIEQWMTEHEGTIAKFREMIARAQANPAAISPAMLSHIANQARNLLRRS